jgi:hypothetical protein
MMQHREPRAMTTSASKLERWDQVRARDRKALANLRAAGRRVDCESWSAEVGRLLRAPTPRAMSRFAACSDS